MTETQEGEHATEAAAEEETDVMMIVTADAATVTSAITPKKDARQQRRTTLTPTQGLSTQEVNVHNLQESIGTMLRVRSVIVTQK